MSAFALLFKIVGWFVNGLNSGRFVPSVGIHEIWGYFGGNIVAWIVFVRVASVLASPFRSSILEPNLENKHHDLADYANQIKPGFHITLTLTYNCLPFHKQSLPSPTVNPLISDKSFDNR